MTERFILIGAALFVVALLVMAGLSGTESPLPTPEAVSTALDIPAEHPDKEWLDQEVVKSPVPVILEFGAVWCGPCKMMAPVLDEFESRQKGKAKVLRVDVDEKPDLATLFNASSIPLLLVIDDGKIVNGVQGMSPEFTYEKLLELVQPHMN